MKKRLLTTLAVGISMLSIADIANAAISWSNQTANTVTAFDIVSLGGLYIKGYGINNAGQVTGDWSHHAFVTTLDGTMTDLGTFDLIYNYYSGGRGINDAGQVTGGSDTAGGYTQHVFMTTPSGAMTDLGTLGGVASYGLGINDTGQVTGGANTATGDFHAFVTTINGTMTDLGTLIGGTLLGGHYSVGNGINNVGQVTGVSTTADSYHAFVWTPGGTMIDLGTLLGGSDSYGYGINDAGQVTGHSFIADDSVNHAFVWEDGTMYDLNSFVNLGSSGEYLSSAYAINDFSQIVANSNLGKVYVLTPSAVPIPGAVWLLGSSLVGLAGFRWKKKAAVS
jgi:probable HAF family extracellular repeat protein